MQEREEGYGSFDTVQTMYVGNIYQDKLKIVSNFGLTYMTNCV